MKAEGFKDIVSRLDDREFQYIAKLVCLLRYAPGFGEELKRLVPIEGGSVSYQHFKATNALMNEWLTDRGWRGLLQAELKACGVFCC